MKNYLDEIILEKKREVAVLLQALQEDPNHPLHGVLEQNKNPNRDFSRALKIDGLSVIAEIKRKSPSRGKINEIQDPIELALQYCEGGASAISVLTDRKYFGGSIDDLHKISKELKERYPKVATLRKDFIIHPIQIAEAAYTGASAVLLIARILGKDLKPLLMEASRLGLEALVEVHDVSDVNLALEAGATIIGINHRDLTTFSIDLSLSEKLKKHIPSHIITIAESGIHTPHHADQMRRIGFDSILVGEALVSSSNPSFLIEKMKGSGTKVKICGITHPEDAILAAKHGADFIGVIFSSKSKRQVSLPLAKTICEAARKEGVEPIGVFVDETYEEIVAICKEAQIQIIQLHGEQAKKSLPLLQNNQIFCAFSHNENPFDLPSHITPLFDNKEGGSGNTFNFDEFSPPKTPFILAGGLNKDNVAHAIQLFKPYAVDVASGVEYEASTRKDPSLVRAFIQEAKRRKL